MSDEFEVEVFRAGDYGAKGVWSEALLDQMAADYDPALHEAPVTVDHAQAGPALGWVGALRRTGDRLVARLRGLNQRLVDMVGQGGYRKRSVELYPALRETGRPYLRAVSFLGAAVPEVKGLADPLLPGVGVAGMFGEVIGRDEKVLVFEETADDTSEVVGAETIDETAVLPGSVLDVVESSRPVTDTGEEAENQAQFDDSASNACMSSAIEFSEAANRLRALGKWRPAWTERGIAEFYQALAVVDEVTVGEGQSVNAAEWFLGFLESLPPVVALGEAAPAVSFDEDRIPQGANVDPESIALHRAAVAYQQAHPGQSYAAALAACVLR